MFSVSVTDLGLLLTCRTDFEEGDASLAEVAGGKKKMGKNENPQSRRVFRSVFFSRFPSLLTQQAVGEFACDEAEIANL